mmetsp:Transcript_11304/g.40093  ORF Transcript_11304/g.40093 Transcript_11304/m.40093 type:complete len:124 (+) Transcript_11304:1068-1439(+)
MHIAEIEPCLGDQGEAPMPSECANFTGEVGDIHAYRAYARTVVQDSSARVSPLLVALHNMVTASVSPEYLIGGDRHFFCVDQVLRALPGAFVDDLPPFGVSEGPAALGTGLPGLDPNHRLVKC